MKNDLTIPEMNGAMDSSALCSNPLSLIRTETSFRRSRKYTPLDRGHKCGFSSQTTITRCRERRARYEQSYRPLDPFSASMWYCQWRPVLLFWRLTRSNAALSLSFSLFIYKVDHTGRFCVLILALAMGQYGVTLLPPLAFYYYPSSINVYENETAPGSI